MNVIVQATNSTGRGVTLDGAVSVLSHPVIAVLIGGVITGGTTWAFNRRRRSIERKRLRRALCVEVCQMQVGMLKMATDSMLDQSPVHDYFKRIAPELSPQYGEDDEYTESLREVIADSAIAELAPKEAKKLILTSLQSDVYESNLGEIGGLKEAEIASVIRFYKRVNMVREASNIVIETAGDGDTKRLQSALEELSYDRRELEHRERDVLETLSATEFELSHDSSEDNSDSTDTESGEEDT